MQKWWRKWESNFPLLREVVFLSLRKFSDACAFWEMYTCSQKKVYCRTSLRGKVWSLDLLMHQEIEKASNRKVLGIAFCFHLLLYAVNWQNDSQKVRSSCNIRQCMSMLHIFATCERCSLVAVSSLHCKSFWLRCLLLLGSSDWSRKSFLLVTDGLFRRLSPFCSVYAVH